MTIPDGPHALPSFIFSTASVIISFVIFIAGPSTGGFIDNELSSQSNPTFAYSGLSRHAVFLYA